MQQSLVHPKILIKHFLAGCGEALLWSLKEKRLHVCPWEAQDSFPSAAEMNSSKFVTLSCWQGAVKVHSTALQ